MHIYSQHSGHLLKQDNSKTDAHQCYHFKKKKA
jgi:hypothetical protein